MKLLCIDPLTSPLWLELLALHKSDIFHSKGWLQVLAETYGFEIGAYVIVDDAGCPRGGVPYCHINDMRGERFVTLPFSDYCDPLVDCTETWQMLSDSLPGKGTPYTIRCLHSPIPLGDTKLQKTKQANWHGIDLNAEPEILWRRIHESARRAIRKATREGVIVRRGVEISDLRCFFEMHLATRKHKYHLLAQPYGFFEKIWEHFIAREQGFLMIAEYQGEPIGATLFLEWQDKLYYKFNTSDPHQLTIRPNDLIMWEAMQYGNQRGFSTLDLGLSDWGQDGLVNFKNKYASERKVISFLQNNLQSSTSGQTDTHAAHLQQIASINQLLPQLTSLFTDTAMPDELSEKAGNLLYRYFS